MGRDYDSARAPLIGGPSPTPPSPEKTKPVIQAGKVTPIFKNSLEKLEQAKAKQSLSKLVYNAKVKVANEKKHEFSVQKSAYNKEVEKIWNQRKGIIAALKKGKSAKTPQAQHIYKQIISKRIEAAKTALEEVKKFHEELKKITPENPSLDENLRVINELVKRIGEDTKPLFPQTEKPVAPKTAITAATPKHTPPNKALPSIPSQTKTLESFRSKKLPPAPSRSQASQPVAQATPKFNKPLPQIPTPKTPAPTLQSGRPLPQVPPPRPPAQQSAVKSTTRIPLADAQKAQAHTLPPARPAPLPPPAGSLTAPPKKTTEVLSDKERTAFLLGQNLEEILKTPISTQNAIKALIEYDRNNQLFKKYDLENLKELLEKLEVYARMFNDEIENISKDPRLNAQQKNDKLIEHIFGKGSLFEGIIQESVNFTKEYKLNENVKRLQQKEKETTIDFGGKNQTVDSLLIMPFSYFLKYPLLLNNRVEYMEKGIINQLQNLINPLNEGPEKDNIKKILDPLATKISKKEVLKEEEIRQFEEIIRYLEAKTGVRSSEDLKELRKEIKRLQQAIELYKSVSATAQFIQNEIANIEDRKKPKTMEKGG